ncbi:hypothetical protein [Gimesia panareensis]|nr:hypothetical protein [Gimesia panareensis]
MTALTIADLTDLDAALVEQIHAAPSKADILYLEAPIEVLQKARDELFAWAKSHSGTDSDAFDYILKEINYLATPD